MRLILNPSFKERLKAWFTVLILAATSVVTVATSKHDPNKASTMNLQATGTRSYYVASNCPGSLPQEQITVQDGRITYPTYRKFSDFGLPMDIFNTALNPTVRGSVRGVILDCSHSVYPSQSGPNLDVYTCGENSQAVCQVSFEEVRQTAGEYY